MKDNTFVSIKNKLLSMLIYFETEVHINSLFYIVHIMEIINTLGNLLSQIDLILHFNISSSSANPKTNDKIPISAQIML